MIKTVDEYTYIVLLNAIPNSYSDVKSAIKYGRNKVSLDIVMNGLKTIQLDFKVNKSVKNLGNLNLIRGGQDKYFQNKASFGNTNNFQNNKNGQGKSRSKSRPRDECVMVVVNLVFMCKIVLRKMISLMSMQV